MVDWLWLLGLAGGGFLAGLTGALLGLGGGLIVVPYLNLLMGVAMHQAAAIGLISTLAVSCAAAGRYLRQPGLVAVHLGLEVELAAAAGGLLGGYAVGFLSGSILQSLFALLLLYSALHILLTSSRPEPPARGPRPESPWRRRLTLGACLLAGVLSGLLGIGGGLVVVPVLYLVMGLPFKRSTATSNFMMGLTAVPALCGFWARGQLELGLAGPLGAGVLLGATVGSRLLLRLRTRWLKIAFSMVLLATAVEMARRGLSGW